MTKLQLVRPPLDDWYTVGQLEDNVSYPTGLLLLANAVRQKMPDVEVEVIDGNRKPLEETLAKIGGANVVGVTSMYSNYDNALNILEDAKNKGATTAIGGANVTHMGKRILANRSFVDFAVVNDGEEALPEIIKGNAGKSTPNLFYREGNIITESGVRRNAPLTTLFDLEDLTDNDARKPQSIPVSGIRGCLKAQTNSLCDFCSIEHKLKIMKPQLMWEQVRILRAYGFDYFWEAGETVFPGYLNELLRTRPDDLSDTKWKFYICADLVDENVAKTLKELGTREVQIGIETPNNEILQMVGKKARSYDIERAVEAVSKNGIAIHAAIMYGLTGETPESAQKTFEYIKNIVAKYPSIKKITTSHAVPFVGTAMFNRIAGNAQAASEYNGDLDKDDRFDYNALTRIYTKHFTSADFAQMEKLVKETRALMAGRGYGTSFDVNPKIIR